MKKLSIVLLSLLLSVVGALAQVTIGTYGATDATGWSTFTAKPITTGTCAAGTADGTCIYYFSSSGSDGGSQLALTGNTCLSSASPCLTTLKCYNSFRANSADWCLFRKGDTWTGQNFADDGVSCCTLKTGTSASFPWVIGAYDPATPTIVDPPTGGARPKLSVAGVQMFPCQGGGGAGCRAIAIIGLEFVQTNADIAQGQDRIFTGSPSFMNNGNTGVVLTLVENNKLTGFYSGLPALGFPPSTGAYIRRNIFVRNYVFGGNFVLSMNDGATVLNPSTAGSAIGIVEENVFYENGSLLPSDIITFTKANPGVFTWTNNALYTADRASEIRFTASCGGSNAITGSATSTTSYYAYDVNVGGAGKFKLSSSSGANVAIDTTGCSATSLTAVLSLRQPEAFVRTFYAGENADIAGGQVSDRLVYRGNIFGRGYSSPDVMQRAGGNIYDNAYIAGTNGSTQGTAAGFDSLFQDNVLSDFTQKAGWGNILVGINTTDPPYQGLNLGRASQLTHRNLLINSAQGGPSIVFEKGSTGAANRNIVFNWPSGSMSTTANNGGVRPSSSSGVAQLVVTNGGSGYTDGVTNITGCGAGGCRNSAGSLTLAATTSQMPRDGVALLTGITGLTPGITGTLIPFHVLNTNEVTLSGTSVFTGTPSFSSAKLYFPNNINLSGCLGNECATDATGGTGSGFTFFMISIGGVVQAVPLVGYELPTAQYHPGTGYTATDLLSHAGTAGKGPSGAGGGGTGVQMRVDNVTNVVVGTGINANINDPTASNPSVFPCNASCTTVGAATYYDSVLGSGGHTVEQFLQAAIAQEKRTWDPRLTANRGFNPWARVQFGLDASTPIHGQP